MNARDSLFRFSVGLGLALALGDATPTHAGITYQIDINASSVPTGTDALLALQLDNGGPPFQEVTASVGNFTFDNLALGASQTVGDANVSPNFPSGLVTMDNLGTLNAFLLMVQLGTDGNISFDVSLAGPLITAPDGNTNESGTTFAVDLLDSNTFQPLLPGSNPMDGSSAGLVVAPGTGTVQSYEDLPYVTVMPLSAVPEPSSLVILGLGVLTVMLRMALTCQLAGRSGGRRRQTDVLC
jgi:hypothetical protein